MATNVPAIAQTAATQMSDPVNQEMAAENLAQAPVRPNIRMAPAAPQAPQAPQVGGVPQAPPMPTGDDGADSLAAPSDMGSEIARHQVIAGRLNPGGSRQWAENAVAGVQAALAGFGAGGKTPPGAGALYGIGAAARQFQANREGQAKEKAEQDQRQQELDLQRQRVENEQTSQDREYGLRLSENARQQAASVRDMALHDARMRQLTDEHNSSNFQMMKADIDFRNQQLDRESTLESIGAKPMQVAGKDVPAFEDLGKLEEYAKQNKLADNAHDNGYRTRPIYGADGKYHLYEIPDTGPEWHTVKDPDGNPQRIFGDPLSVLNYEGKVAQIHEANARAKMTYERAKHERDQIKDDGTVKKARADLSAAGGDYSKLPEGDLVALRTDAQKRYGAAFNVYQQAQKDMQRDPDWNNVPIDAAGNPDKSSEEYEDLQSKYHIDEAEEDLSQTYDELRKLGHGYAKPNAQPSAPGTVGNPAPPPTTDNLQQNRDSLQAQLDTLQANKPAPAGQIYDPKTKKNVPAVSVNGNVIPKAQYEEQITTLKQQLEQTNQALSKSVSQNPNPQVRQNAPRQAGAGGSAGPQKGDVKTYNGATYIFDGTSYVKQAQ